MPVCSRVRGSGCRCWSRYPVTQVVSASFGMGVTYLTQSLTMIPLFGCACSVNTRAVVSLITASLSLSPEKPHFGTVEEAGTPAKVLLGSRPALYLRILGCLRWEQTCSSLDGKKQRISSGNLAAETPGDIHYIYIYIYMYIHGGQLGCTYRPMTEDTFSCREAWAS